MRLSTKITLLFIFILPVLCFARVDSDEITGSSDTPIPAAYSTTNTQSLSPKLTGLVNKTHICAYNDSASVNAYINVDNGSISSAPATGSNEVLIPHGVGRCITTAGSSRIYLRGASSMTSGSVHIDAE